MAQSIERPATARQAAAADQRTGAAILGALALLVAVGFVLWRPDSKGDPLAAERARTATLGYQTCVGGETLTRAVATTLAGAGADALGTSVTPAGSGEPSGDYDVAIGYQAPWGHGETRALRFRYQAGSGTVSGASSEASTILARMRRTCQAEP